MLYQAKQIANAFLDIAGAAGEKLSPMKLQKLVYFAHGWHLALSDRPLINEQVEAWRFGPVISSLYHEFKHFGNAPITAKAAEIHLTEDGQDIVQSESQSPRDDEIRKFLQRIWEVYGGFTAVQLSNMTHEPNTPWCQVWRPEIPEGTDIPCNLITDYFKGQAAA